MQQFVAIKRLITIYDRNPHKSRLGIPHFDNKAIFVFRTAYTVHSLHTGHSKIDLRCDVAASGVGVIDDRIDLTGITTWR